VRLTWKTPNVGTVSTYSVYRVLGTTVTPQSTKVLVGGAPVSGTTLSIVDNEELPHGVQYTYYIVASFTDAAVSGPSNSSTITAENDAPIANPDSYVVKQNTLLTVAPRGVLANDTDTDSNVLTLTAVLASGPANAVQFSLNANGSFTYMPKTGFKGVDTFTYWTKDVTPLSNRNIATTVTIVVGK
jgi:hypothetical protein